MKPTIFTISIEEIEEKLNQFAYKLTYDVNNAEIEYLIHREIKETLKRFSRMKSGLWILKEKENNKEELFMIYLPDDKGNYFIDSMNTACTIGKIVYKNNKFNVEIYEAKDIKNFDRIRLRLLFM